MPSSYLDGPHYSYHTCGSDNTFVTWFEGTVGVGEHHLPELIATIGHYVKATSISIESSQREFNGLSNLQCPVATTCPCTTCDVTPV